MLNKTYSLRPHCVSCWTAYIYYKMIHGPYNVEVVNVVFGGLSQSFSRQLTLFYTAIWYSVVQEPQYGKECIIDEFRFVKGKGGLTNHQNVWHLTLKFWSSWPILNSEREISLWINMMCDSLQFEILKEQIDFCRQIFIKFVMDAMPKQAAPDTSLFSS